MKKLLTLMAFGLAFSFGGAQAASHAGAAKMDEAKPKQQTKMTMCNQEAGEKKGDERKAFMSSCLKAKPASQQSKMKTCNVEAKDMKGDDRKKFMSECLKK